MTTLEERLPDEWVDLFASDDDARRHLTRAAVLDLVRRRRISQGRGAELLGISLWDFHEMMAEYDVPVVDVQEDEPDTEHRNLKDALGAHAHGH